MLKDKIRIYVLAKELDVDCKDLIALCHRLEFDIKNQLSSLEPVQREEVETIISKGGLNTAGAAGAKPSTPSVATPVAAAPSVIAPTKPPTIAKPAAVKKEPASAKTPKVTEASKKTLEPAATVVEVAKKYDNGSEYWFHVLTTKGGKWHSIDKNILENLTVGDMHSAFSKMIDWNMWKKLNTKTWASMAFVMNA